MPKVNDGSAYPVEFLRECFVADASLHKYRWRARPQSHFKSERACKAWNTAYAGKLAGSLDAYGRHVVCLTYGPAKEKKIGLDLIAARLGDSTSLAYGLPRAHGVTADEREARYDALEAIVAEIQPCSVRQVFYQAVVRGLIDKTETAYDVVQHALVQLRRCGRVPYEWLRDGTRQTFKPTTYSSVGEAIQDIVDGYRKALWDEADVRVEVWLEKDALTDVVYPVTNVYDVPLRVARGFSSLSFLADAATEMEADGKDVYVYHLGDHDPSGRSAGEAIERDLTELAPSVEIHFERIAVTVEQIAGFDLPTRPTKRTDSRAAKFEAEFGRGSVELDAIHPDTLRAIVREAISQHMPFAELEALHAAERKEKRMLERFAAKSRNGGRP